VSAPRPEIDVATAIAAALGWTLGTQIKTGSVRSPTEPGNDTVRCWVLPYAETATPLLNASVIGSMFETRVQAVVLGEADSEEAGWALARQIRDAIHTRAPSGYIRAALVPGVGGPNYLGVNEAGMPRWTLNWTLLYQWAAP
jgi:hypothetical protein